VTETHLLEGTLLGVTYLNEETGYVVARLEVAGPGGPRGVTVVGNLLGVNPGESVRLKGEWVRHIRYGEQFKVEGYESILPASVTGIERYLASGLIKGIGPVYAKRLVEAFGQDTLRIIEEDPEHLLTVEGIGPVRLRRIRDAWMEQRELRGVILFLQEHQVSSTFAVKIFKAYGSQALLLMREDPYRLARDITGIGFKTADRIAASLGIAKDSPKRVAAGLLYLLQQATEEGHVYCPASQLTQQCCRLLELEDEGVVQQALQELIQEGGVVAESRGGERAIYLAPLHQAEEGVSRRLALLVKAPHLGPSIDIPRALEWIEAQEGLRLAPEQREALAKALSTKVLIITGGPGTGKTTLLQCLIRILERKGVRVLLAAPTGRAAKRMTEATGREAKTLHRLLEFSPKEGQFKRNEARPLEADLVVVDEASMMDLFLMHHLVKALPPMSALLLVGDADQLPSVGPGAILQDLIASGVVPVVRLTEIFRQAKESLIVMNAHRVNRGEFPRLADFGSADCAFIEVEESEAIRERVRDLVTHEIPTQYHLDPLREIQVITPMNRGPIGVLTLNQDLQEALNPRGAEVIRSGRRFRLGDRVMQIRNNYEKEVYNGDIGWISRVDLEEQALTVRYEEGERAYDFSELDELALAYAISVHKSQGSEYPVVVLPLHTSHYVMLQRNLLYTALSRGKALVVVVGTKEAVAIALRNVQVRQRYTLLAARLSGHLTGERG
jgi:exodeoxyribonuclease V alpha subunit